MTAGVGNTVSIVIERSKNTSISFIRGTAAWGNLYYRVRFPIVNLAPESIRPNVFPLLNVSIFNLNALARVFLYILTNGPAYGNLFLFR